MIRYAIFMGALFSGIAVALGAFGAHALREQLSAKNLATFEVGVRYQFYHGLALILLGIAHRTGAISGRITNWATLGFVVGMVFFSGSIYLLALTDLTWPGPITPLGGVLFMASWILTMVMAWPSRTPT